MPRPPRRSAGAGRTDHGLVQARQLLEDSDPLAAVVGVDPATVEHTDDLGALILTAHQAVIHHKEGAVRAATLAGRFLGEVRERLRDTGAPFADWCESIGLARRTAYNYLAVAARVERTGVLPGSVREALAPEGETRVTLPATRVSPGVVSALEACAQERGLKTTALVAQIVDEWLARNHGTIDVEAQ